MRPMKSAIVDRETPPHNRAIYDREISATASRAAFLPAMRPWTVHLANPWRLNPPADSPPQYRPGMTLPEKSITWHLALILRPARVS